MAFKILNSNIIDDTRNIINAASVGINTTSAPTVQKLWVEGAGYFSGIASASRFISNVAQGTSPISVASSTRVDTLNVQYLDGNDSSFYRNASNLNAGAVPGAQVTQSSGLTITGNLNVSGNVSVSGTSFALSAQQLRITDRDITLGITTDANGNDVSTDTTANHGGVAIASTEGTPILNIPTQAGVNTDPSTYKQMMWIRSGNYSGMGTDAWVFNYAVSIGNTASVQNLSRLTVGAGFTVYDTYLDATDIRARNLNVTGVITSGNHNVTTGNTYQINGTTVLSNNTLGSGVVNSSLTSVGTLGILNVTGVTTSGGFNATTGTDYKINGTSVLTSTTLGSAVVNSSLTSVGTLGILNVTGVITSGNHNVTTGNTYQINGTTVLSNNTLGSGVVNSSLTSVGTLGILNVTGVTTSGGVNVTTGNDYKINGTTVLSNNTLGSGVVNSSLTSVGTLGSLSVTNAITSGSLSVTGVTTSGGFNATTGNDYKINGTSVLTSTTLGSAVVNSSLTSVGTLGILNVTGVTTSGGVNVTTGNDYKINGTSVLNATTLGSGVLTSSLTSVGTLPTLTATNITNTNINSSGINTAATFSVGATTVISTVSSQIRLAGIATIDATTKATLERELAFAPNDFDSLNVSGISTLRTTTLIGGGTSTGTANQVLQVTGISSGAYIGGNLGIAITNPSQPLDVNGNVRFRSGIYDVNNTVGAANSVLTANGSGGWSWQPVVSGGGAAISGINVTQDDTGIRYPLLAAGTNATTTAQYVDATALVYNTSSNCLGIGSLTPTSRLHVEGDVRVSGIVTAGDFNSSSDIKLKTNIQRIANPIEKVLQINGVSFNWKETGKATVGVIAQEVEKVLPELVSDTDPKTVNYNGLIGLLIECVKDQQRQIDELRNIT